MTALSVWVQPAASITSWAGDQGWWICAAVCPGPLWALVWDVRQEGCTGRAEC